MIITLTLNPALDKTAYIDPLISGGLNRIQKSELDAGGKGINVSKLIAVLNGQSIATGFVGGSNGLALLQMIDELKLKHDFVKVQGSTRINLKLLDAVNGITEINDPGVLVTEEEENLLLDKLFSFITQDSGKTIFVLAGSMHLHANHCLYKDLTAKLKSKGAKVFVDADGLAFAEALKAEPDFIKPNKEELLQYFKRENENVTTADLIKLCKELINTYSIGMIALSLGSEGAIFVTAEKCAVAPALKVKVSSTVGAGDSMVGAIAYAYSQNYSFEDIVCLAMACSAGAVTTQGTKAPSLDCINNLLKQVTFDYH